MVLKQLVVFADSDVSLRLETVADQTAISSNTVSPAPLRIRRSTLNPGDLIIKAQRNNCMRIIHRDKICQNHNLVRHMIEP